MTPLPKTKEETTFRFLLHGHVVGGEGRCGVLITPDITIRKNDEDWIQVFADVGNGGSECVYAFHAQHDVRREQTLLAMALETSFITFDSWSERMYHRRPFVDEMAKMVQRNIGIMPTRFHVDNVLPPLD